MKTAYSNGYQQQPNLHHRPQVVVSPLYIKDTLEQENSKLKHQINMLEGQLGKSSKSPLSTNQRSSRRLNT